MKKEISNPLFESLLKRAKEYKFNTINEEVESKFKSEEQASKYIKNILRSWFDSIFYFSQSCPVVKIKLEVLPYTMSSIEKIQNNATIEDLIKSLKEISKGIVDKISNEKVLPIYEKFLEGTKKLEEAYESYKKMGSEFISNPSLVKSTNEFVKVYIETAKKSIEASKSKTK